MHVLSWFARNVHSTCCAYYLYTNEFRKLVRFMVGRILW